MAVEEFEITFIWLGDDGWEIELNTIVSNWFYDPFELCIYLN